ncbi:MAG: hypothetical protein ACFFGZ_06455 [Candidatus Thorarchaeota archaeon]
MKTLADVVETITGEHNAKTLVQRLNILSYLDRVNWPLTAATIAHKFNYSVKEAQQLLDGLYNDGVGFLQKRIVLDGTTYQTYYAFSFPETFDKICAQCSWFADNYCRIWRTVSKQLSNKLPETLKTRGSCLFSESIACPAYQSTDSPRLITAENWGALSNTDSTFSEDTDSSAAINCLLCGAPIQSLFDTTRWCSSCGAEFFLEYEDTGELVIIIFPDFDWLFAEKVEQIKTFINTNSWAVTVGP